MLPPSDIPSSHEIEIMVSIDKFSIFFRLKGALGTCSILMPILASEIRELPLIFVAIIFTYT